MGSNRRFPRHVGQLGGPVYDLLELFHLLLPDGKQMLLLLIDFGFGARGTQPSTFFHLLASCGSQLFLKVLRCSHHDPECVSVQRTCRRSAQEALQLVHASTTPRSPRACCWNGPKHEFGGFLGRTKARSTARPCFFLDGPKHELQHTTVRWEGERGSFFSRRRKRSATSTRGVLSRGRRCGSERACLRATKREDCVP